MKIQEIHSFEHYEDFIGELAGHPFYSDPHFTFSKDNLYHSIMRKDEYAFAVSENGKTEGLFVWLVIPDDRYIEMIIGLTGKEEAFTEMLSVPFGRSRRATATLSDGWICRYSAIFLR